MATTALRLPSFTEHVKSMKKAKVADAQRIELFIYRASTHCQNVIQGITHYARPAKNWIIGIQYPEINLVKKTLASRPSGIIAQVNNKKLYHLLEESGLPYIDVTDTIQDDSIKRICVDHVAIGKMAAEYFLENRFREFGFVGEANHRFSMLRESGYVQTLRDKGYNCYILRRNILQIFQPSLVVAETDNRLAKWLKSLPLPIALFSATDSRAVKVLEMCRKLGLKVPAEVAVLGVDNDTLLCNLEYPPLSSIALPSYEIGYQAAKMLDALMAGETVKRSRFFFPPQRVVVRQSSDIMAVNDKLVAEALAFIRAHAGDPITVKDVCSHTLVSRRLLEMRFKQELGWTPLEEIRRARIARAKLLLTDTDSPMSEVAANSGFQSSARFCVVFRQYTGITPIAYRGKFRNH
jgi:LacI family transcriptional regulator